MDGRSPGAVTGIAACAWVLAHAVDAYADAGGEGSRRMADALDGVSRELSGASARDLVHGARGAHPRALPGDGVDAARAALGAAAAGQRVALFASGDALAAIQHVVREMARVGVPVVLIVASHGDEGGKALPEPGPADLASVLDGPVGMLLAGEVSQVADLTLAALRASSDRGAPWVVGFDLASVGLHPARVELPTPEAIRGWMSASIPPAPPPSHRSGSGTGEAHTGVPGVPGVAHLREVERYGFAIGAALRETERVSGLVPGRRCGLYLHDGPRDADVVLVSAGSSAVGARRVATAGSVQSRGQDGGGAGGHGLRVAAVQVLSLRPLPTVDLVRWTWRARLVLVHEVFPEALGTGGRLSDALKAAYADALTWHPDHTGIGRVPTVVTLYAPGTIGERGWRQAVRSVDTQEPARWLAIPPEAPTVPERSGAVDVGNMDDV